MKIKRVYRLSRDELLPRVRRRGGSFYRNDVDKSRKMISLERDGVSRGVGGFLRCSRNGLAVKHKSEGEGERASTRAVNEYIYKVTKLSKTREHLDSSSRFLHANESIFFSPSRLRFALSDRETAEDPLKVKERSNFFSFKMR